MRSALGLSLAALTVAALFSAACADEQEPPPTTPATPVTLPPEPLAGLDPALMVPSLAELGDAFAGYTMSVDMTFPNPEDLSEPRLLTELARLGRITGYVRQFLSPDGTLLLGLSVHIFADEEGASAALALLRDERLAIPGNELQSPIAIGDEVAVLLIAAEGSAPVRDITFRVGAVLVNLFLQPQQPTQVPVTPGELTVLDGVARVVEGKARAALAALP